MSIEARFRIDRGDFALDVDLTLPDRGVTAIFGPSGCGKTTLLRVIAGLEKVQQGDLKVGDSVWQDGQQFLPTHKRPLGYVFQEPSLFDHLDVQRNLEYGIRRTRNGQRRVALEQAIELLGIGHLLKRRPYQLSGGEQQRVAIARALAVEPEVMLLDEPLAALDQTRKQEILPYLESLHQELAIPVLYVSHSRNEVARLADHLVLLDTGRVQAQGPLMEIFSRLDLALVHGPDTETVIEAQVVGHDEDYDLTYLAFSGGQFAVARNSTDIGSQVRLQVVARDVSLTLERQSGTSILNIFPAVVEELAQEGGAQVTVKLSVGQDVVLARITRKSAVELDLKPGKPVYAQIKSVALLK